MYQSISNNSIYSPISSSLFNIPSPSLQYEDELFFQYYYLHDHHFLQQPQPLITSDYQNHDDALAESTETAINMEDPNKLEEEEEGCNKNKKGNGMSSKRTNIPRNKRVHKKDRHSKIHTAQGPRDRRIRLSIDIARNFFNLQDMLEFNKASKTVEWLLIKSKSAIKELVHINKQSCSNNVIGANSTSSTSECEVVSGVDEYSPSNYHQKKKENAKGISCCKEKNKKKKLKTVRRAPAFHHPFAKESRKQARERARERTIKKNFGVAMGHDGLNLRSWSEESGRNCMNHPPNEMAAEVELISNHEKQLLGSKESIVNDCSFLFTGNWSQYSIFNYQKNAETFHEHQFTASPFS